MNVDPRVLEAVRQVAVSVFGSEEAAEAWLHERNPVLEGRSPVEAIATPEGHRATVSELKRIEYSAPDRESDLEG